jgi:2-dehydropantoate 2-reductase
MRFVVFGAGAIGGVVGARLAQAGADVVLVARGAHAKALRTSGLRLEAPEGGTTLRLPVVERADELACREDDVILLATKSQDTSAAVRDLAAVAPTATAIVSVQNGVANERAAARLFANVYGVCVMLPAEHLDPGVVVAHSSPLTGLLDIGLFPSGADDRAAEIAAAFGQATFEAEVRENIMAWKYRKLLLNLGNAVEATCAPGTGRRELIDLLRREGEEVLCAAGVDVVSAADDARRRGDLLRLHDVGGRGRGGSSTWQSLARKTGTVETDYLNGEIVLLGRLHGVRAPANELLQRTVRELAWSRATPASLSAAELLERLRAQS